ncbi:hypothetical protein [uncultured Neptuniibacter sp.]|uniref:hypothetical protein n=1 Tax=uncultured Neptuniibacter sp. TaxID=502143 RepID=UPI002613F282|nr:hypothetical protein [uncultured Neptuniibacter sp.]
MKSLIILTAATLLSACISSPRMLPSDSYLVDTQRGLMCHVGKCYYIDLIHPSYNELRIAKAYRLDTRVYSWGADELAALMLKPPHQQYTVTQLSETEFSLPITYETQTAFYVLEEEYNQLYKGGKARH